MSQYWACAWHDCCSWEAMHAATFAADDFADDEPTLVHSRDVTAIRALLGSTVLGPTPIPPPLPASLSRVHRELAPDDLWLASLPAESRATLDRARRGQVSERARVASPVSLA